MSFVLIPLDTYLSCNQVCVVFNNQILSSSSDVQPRGMGRPSITLVSSGISLKKSSWGGFPQQYYYYFFINNPLILWGVLSSQSFIFLNIIFLISLEDNELAQLFISLFLCFLAYPHSSLFNPLHCVWMYTCLPTAFLFQFHIMNILLYLFPSDISLSPITFWSLWLLHDKHRNLKVHC